MILSLCYLPIAATATTGYLGTADGFIYTFNPSAMGPAIQFTTTPAGDDANGVAIHGSTGYIASRDGFIYTFNPSAMGPAIQFTTTNVVNALGVAIHGTKGYIAALDGFIYTFNPTAGGIATQFTTTNSGGFADGVAIHGATGYIAANDGFIYTFNPTAGGIATKFTTTNSGGVAYDVAIHDTTGYIAATDAFIYTFNPSAMGPAIQFTTTNPGGKAFCVAFPDASEPQSIGPYGSCFNSLFALTQIYERHAVTHHKRAFRERRKGSKEIGLLADAADYIRFRQSLNQKPIVPNEPNYSLWGAVFGSDVHQKADREIPAYTNAIAGATLALDYLREKDAVMGGGVSYAFNYVHMADGTGHAKINQEFVTLYGSWNRSLFVNAAIWGGLYQLNNERHDIDAEVTLTASAQGCLFSPHLELSVPRLYRNWIGIDPFVIVDWANIWQRHFTEEGFAGFNLALGGQHSSLLRTELGMRFLQILHCGWGRLVIEEKGSWVNKKPFHAEAKTAFFVGTISPFNIETFSSTMQNLGAGELSIEFIPTNPKVPYWTLDYQGEFGSMSHSNMLSLTVGKDF